MKKYILLFIISFISTTILKAQDKSAYFNTLSELKQMLEGTKAINFKLAVFNVENAFLDNQLSYDEFNLRINFLTTLCNNLIKAKAINYNQYDKDNVEKNGAIFKVLTDTIRLIFESDTFSHYGFSYDFDDIWGEGDWTKMFVTKLLLTKKGNCHSLPYLYKILADTLGANAYLSLAPNHIYIKTKSKKEGWYNTELTSASFPRDYWIMASGYISLEAIQNSIYMDTINAKESIALCVIDLAKGYERKYGVTNNQEFIIECCDLALKYYPHYINALLLKAETYKTIYEEVLKTNNTNNPKDLNVNKEAKLVYETMEFLYSKIYDLGYRSMPSQMYRNWLSELNKEKIRQLNTELNSKLNHNNK